MAGVPGHDRPLRHDLDEVGAVRGGAVDVGEHGGWSIVTASMRPGDHDVASAARSPPSGRRRLPAPVTPTRMAPSFIRATNTPAMA